MPRLVRRKPVWERITTALNPMDFMLWLSEEMETRDWNSESVGTYFGLGFNFVLLLTRANTGRYSQSDDLFSDDTGSSWLIFFTYPLMWFLVAASAANAFHALTRSRKYRLFEADIDVAPSSSSARRVKVQSDPSSPTVQRILSNLVASETAESRAHPDKTRDVWELSVWDPLPFSLQLFCLFGPGHVLVYLMLLPLAPLDPRPSVTVFNCLVLQITLSATLIVLTSKFAQQTKDRAIIDKEVLHEYNAKFVHPRLRPVVREVGTQVSGVPPHGSGGLVEVGTPTTVIQRSFKTHPNPNYMSHVDTGVQDTESSHPANVMRPQMFTPTAAPRRSEFTANSFEPSSAIRRSLPFGYAAAPSPSMSATPSNSGTLRSPEPNSNTSFGGYMGAYTHQNSPLKKATSMNDVSAPLPRNSREMAAYEQSSATRSPSPQKSTSARKSTGTMVDGYSAKMRTQQERFPSRRW